MEHLWWLLLWMNQAPSLRNQTDIPISEYTAVNLCFREGENNFHQDVSFLITTDQINNPVLEFNAIEHIAQTTDDKLLMKLFQTSFEETDVNRVQAFVNLLENGRFSRNHSSG